MLLNVVGHYHRFTENRHWTGIRSTASWDVTDHCIRRAHLDMHVWYCGLPHPISSPYIGYPAVSGIYKLVFCQTLLYYLYLWATAVSPGLLLLAFQVLFLSEAWAWHSWPFSELYSEKESVFHSPLFFCYMFYRIFSYGPPYYISPFHLNVRRQTVQEVHTNDQAE